VSDWYRHAHAPVGTAAVGLAYFALARFGLALASLHPSASPVWPPSGLALACVLLWGPRVWPGIAAGAFVANITIFGSILSSSAIAVGNTLEALITAWLITRWSGGIGTFDTPSRVVRFAGLTIAPGSIVGATIGVSSLIAAGHADVAEFSSIWLTWWLGDVGGQILVTPVVLLWARTRSVRLDRAEMAKLAQLIAGTAAVGIVAFSPLMEQTAVRGALAFLAIGPMLWAALRYSQRETATAALLLSCFAIWGTIANGGPFARPSANESFLLVLTFVISTALPSLVLSTDVALRRKSEARRALLLGELQHRTKNMLAVIQSIVGNTLRRTTDLESARGAIVGRLHALGRAQDFVTLESTCGVPLRKLIEAELAPFAARARLQGVPVVVSGTFAQTFALIVHELATNATKHGALSSENGRVLISWKIDEGPPEPRLDFSWVERGGPPAVAPQASGFGTHVIALLGDPRLSFAADGFEYSVSLPLAELTTEPK
jgi:two-component sensor histidine kinase